jgi:hypothetical protein
VRSEFVSEHPAHFFDGDVGAGDSDGGHGSGFHLE